MTSRPSESCPEPADALRARTMLRQALRSHSFQADLSELARTRKQAHVVTLQTLETVMLEAIENVLLEGGDPLLDRGALQQRAREEFHKLLESRRQAVSERDEAERGRRDLERQVRLLHKELAEQRTRLERELARAVPEIGFSEPSLVEMESRLRAVVLRALAEQAGGDAGAARVERQVQRILERTMEVERDKARVRVREARDLEVDRLRRRIEKLNEALDGTEARLRRVAAAKGVESGVASVYRDVQGPADDEVNRERKQDMIKVVFVNNLLLRNREVRPEDLEGVPDELLIRPERSSLSRASVAPSTDETAF